MRYFYRGLLRESGRTVEGHVEANNPDHAYNVLSSNGVITETLAPDPKPLQLGPETSLPTSPQYADAIDSALDSASSQVDFDSLVDRYKGKRVWVIDRDKIRVRVAQVVDAALTESHHNLENTVQMRARVATAIHGLFADTRNIATERSLAEVQAERARQGGSVGGAVPTPALEQQIGRLTKLVDQAESVLAAMSLAARSGGGGSGRPRRYTVDQGFTEEQNSVLLEVFKSNLELARSLESIGGSIHSARAREVAGQADQSGSPPSGGNGPGPPRERPAEPPGSGAGSNGEDDNT